jgi:hypothetical protein
MSKASMRNTSFMLFCMGFLLYMYGGASLIFLSGKELPHSFRSWFTPFESEDPFQIVDLEYARAMAWDIRQHHQQDSYNWSTDLATAMLLTSGLLMVIGARQPAEQILGGSAYVLWGSTVFYTPVRVGIGLEVTRPVTELLFYAGIIVMLWFTVYHPPEQKF